MKSLLFYKVSAMVLLIFPTPCLQITFSSNTGFAGFLSVRWKGIGFRSLPKGVSQRYCTSEKGVCGECVHFQEPLLLEMGRLLIPTIFQIVGQYLKAKPMVKNWSITSIGSGILQRLHLSDAMDRDYLEQLSLFCLKGQNGNVWGESPRIANLSKIWS